jgi:hypothetical protein
VTGRLRNNGPQRPVESRIYGEKFLSSLRFQVLTATSVKMKMAVVWAQEPRRQLSLRLPP